MAKFKIKLFGTFELIDPAGDRIAVPGAKQQALLAILAASKDVAVSRDRLIGLLWGDRFPDQARQSLRQALLKLRQSLTYEDSCALLTDPERVSLDQSSVSVDLHEFSRLTQLREVDADMQAIDTYQNTFLDGLFVKEAAFEEWLSVERSNASQLSFPVFERLAANKLQSGDQAEALQLAQRLTAIDPLRENSHRLLMRLFAQSGQRSAAIRQYQKCADVLKAELDVGPSPETKAILDEIKSPSPTPEIEPSLETAKKKETSTKGSSKVRITTFPIRVSGSSPELADFAEALNEDLMTALTRFRWLDVVAPILSEDGTFSISKLRHEAKSDGVAYSVEGSARQLGDRLRTTVQLVELCTGKYVGAHRDDHKVSDLMSLLDAVSERAAATVEAEIAVHEGEKARSQTGDAMSAWDCYHLGLSTQYEFSPEGNARAQALFRRAIDLDPSFSAAYSRLSYAMVLSAIYFDADPANGLLDGALEHARTATRLDDQDAIARFALGRVHLARGEYQRSIDELEQAIEMNTSLAQAYCGLGDSLAYMGRADEAIPHFEEAVRLSPQDPHRWAFSTYAAIASILSGNFEDAVEWALIATRVPNSHFWANSALVSALGHLGRIDEARSAYKELDQMKPDFCCDYVRDRLFYLSDEAQVDQYVEGLRRAGVREIAT